MLNDVRQVSKEVINYTQKIGGFMVSVSLFLNKKGEKKIALVAIHHNFLLSLVKLLVLLLNKIWRGIFLPPLLK